MAVAVAEPIPKSQPDISKLNTYTGHTVTCTKHTAPRGTVGQMVVPTQQMSLKEILALHMSVPLQHGPGFYRFQVSDTGGTGEDVWMTRLGSEVTPQEGYQMPTSFGPPPTMPPLLPNAPMDTDVKQIMPGWFFNEALGLLSTPWRETIQWRMGDALPKPPTSASHLAAVPANASPWNWPPQGGGWGGYPTAGSSEVDALKAELAEQKRQREMDELRAEQRRRDDDMQKRMDQQATQFRELIEKLASKPSGPTEAERDLQRRLDQLTEKLSKTGPSDHELRMERELQEEKRRREDGDRERIAEERRRNEMREMQDKFERTIKEVAGNKVDPVMTIFKEIMTAQSASAADTVRTIRDAAAATAAVAERNAITPAQVIDMVRTARDGASESSKVVMDTMRGLMKTQQEVMTQMIDLAGNNNQPWYAGAIQEGLNKVGMIGTALAERNAAAQAQPQAPVAQPRRVVPAPQAQVAQAPRAGQAPAQVRPAGPAAAAVAPAPVPPALAGRATNTGARPEGTVYIKDKDVFILPDGRNVANDIVQREGWDKVLKMAPYEPGAPAIPVGQVPVNGVVATAAPVAPASPVNGKGKKKLRAVAPAAPAPVVEVLPPPPAMPPPPANGQGYTLGELRELEPDQIRLVVNPLEDSTLFGPLMSSIVDLRARVAKGMSAEDAAEAVLGSRQYLSSFGGQLPPAFELLAAEHFEVLVERLLPEASGEYQEAVADAIERVLEAEGGEEEGEEAQT